MIARHLVMVAAVAAMHPIAQAGPSSDAERVATIDARSSNRTIIVDGRCQAQEWQGISEVGQIRAFRNGDQVFICIAMPDGGLGSLDIFIGRPDGTTLNLHSSAQIAQRVLRPGSEAPPFEWGAFDGLYAPPFAFAGLRKNDANDVSVTLMDVSSREVVLERHLVKGRCVRLQIRLEAVGKLRRGSWHWPDEGWGRLCV